MKNKPRNIQQSKKQNNTTTRQRTPINAVTEPKMPKQFKRLDSSFVILIMIMLAYGLVMVFSASYAVALHKMNNSFHFIIRQTIFAVLGIVAMYFISLVDYHLYRRFAIWIFGGGIGLLILVLIPGIGQKLNNARRWINLGFTNFQPSDVMKFALIVLFAHLITLNYKRMGTFRYGVMPFSMCLMAIASLMILQPHLSGTILMFLIGLIMMFVGGTKLRYFFILIGVAAAGFAGIMLVNSNYMLTRISNWLNPFENLQGGNWQTAQSLIAIGSGGVLGRGLGASHQKFLYLPEAYNDFLFAIICEELGLVGAMLVIILFIIFTFRGYSIAAKSPDRFGFMLGMGIVTQICVQAVLNIAVVTNTVPNTGISLPFFSYGGTALMMQLGEMGVLLNISRQAASQKL